MEEVTLDWAGAEVSDAKLTVALDSDPPKGWMQSFQATVALLGSGEWESVKLKSGKVHVTGVHPGAEDKLRHFLEGVVQQANADHDASQAQAKDESVQEEDQPADGPDAEMTERFRSFDGG